MSRARVIWGVAVTLSLLCGWAAGQAGKNKATAPGDDLLTGENYARIHNGMTVAEVKEILGPSRSSMTSAANHDMTLTWRPRNDMKHHVEVHFKEGKVISKSTNMDFAAMAAKTNEVGLKANFERLHAGMTEQEVRAIMGAPAKTDRASAGRSGFTWEMGERFALVIFQDGKASDMDCSEVPAKNKEITPANYHRLHKGMSLAEVEAILGPAEESVAQGNGQRCTWKEGNKTLTVAIGGGKLTAKTSTIKDLPLVQFEKTEDDRYATALANLSSADHKQQLSAIEFFKNEPFDPAKALEASKALNRPLASKEASVAHEAGIAVKKWATKENVEHFLKIVERPPGKSVLDKKRDDLPLALEILAKIKEPAAVPHMCRLLKDFFVRGEAVNALRLMGPELAEAELQKYANDKSADVRKAAGDILEEFKDGGGAHMAKTLADLKSSSRELRSLACQELCKMYVHPRRKQEVSRALEPLLKDSDQYVATFAAKALGRWGGSENESALIAALSNAHAEVRCEAAAALREVGTSKSLSDLEKLSTDGDKRVTLAAKEAVIGIKAKKG